jgi:hypothetical protein
MLDQLDTTGVNLSNPWFESWDHDNPYIKQIETNYKVWFPRN